MTTEEVISKSDAIYSEKQWDQLYTHLKEALAKEENQVGEVFWRMARACREKANTTTDKEQKKSLTAEGFENSLKGVTKEPESFGCNKWHGIMLDLTARLEGTKKRIENSFLVKQHLMKAAEIDPKDATIEHTLGVWCFEVADLGWMQRKLAAAFFATPPTSSYEEALQHLEGAEKISPHFYCFNLVYLGKCHLRMGDKAKAKEALQKALDLEKKNTDDDEAKKEAADLIKKC